MFFNYIFINFNYCLEKGEYPSVLKHAGVVIAIFLDNLSKIYENLKIH